MRKIFIFLCLCVMLNSYGVYFVSWCQADAAQNEIQPKKQKTPSSYYFLMAIIQAESAFNQHAVSPKGAKGLLQLTPEVCRKYGVTDPFDPQQNLKGGMAYFQSLLERFQDVTLALAAYNAGPSQVEKFGGVPPFPETQQFIRKVFHYYRWFQKNVRLEGDK